MAEMTKEVLEEACKKNGGYRQPRLNDQLFLQCKGFAAIGDLSEYTSLKVLWLDQNAISKMENLDKLPTLASLFLQNNTIRVMEGLHNLANLRILNLSHNYISRIGDLSHCPLLETLELTHNRITCLEDCEELWNCPELSCVDLSHNQISAPATVPPPSQPEEDSKKQKDAAQDDDDDVIDLTAQIQGVNSSTTTATSQKLPQNYIVDFFKKIPKIAVIYLHGNELPRKMTLYRKTLVAGIKTLTYLDERPIFPDERKTVDAWAEGGAEAEEKAREEIRQAKLDHLTSTTKMFMQMREEKKEEREKNEKIWAEKQAAAEERQRLERVERRREQNELDHEEYESRGLIEVEEECAWNDEIAALAPASLAACAEAEKDRIEKDRVEHEATLELEAEAQRLQKEMEAQRVQQNARNEEMKYWIDKFALEDFNNEAAMADDFNAMMQQLIPGAAVTAHQPSPNSSASADSNKQSPQKGQQASATATASADEGICSKSKQQQQQEEGSAGNGKQRRTRKTMKTDPSSWARKYHWDPSAIEK